MVEYVTIGKWINYFEFIFSLFFFAALIACFTAIILAPKPFFILKTRLNIFKPDTEKQDCIYLSVYNGSSATISKLHVRIIARVLLAKDNRKNILIKDSPPAQPLAEPYIPLRFKGSLEGKNLFVTEVDEQGLVRKLIYKNHPNQLCEVEEIYVEIFGTISAIQQRSYTEYRYVIAKGDISYRKYDGSIRPDYNLARNGNAWQLRRPPEEVKIKFNNDEGGIQPLNNDAMKPTKTIYIFGYGSLVDPNSFNKTLDQKSDEVVSFKQAKLLGYRRNWNVAMDNSLRIEGYKYYVDMTENIPLDGMVSFLNIERIEEPVNESKPSVVIGAIMIVSPQDIEKFDIRERNYNRVDVTDQIEAAPENAIIYAYVGKKEAIQRFNVGTYLKKIYRSKSYADKVAQAHENLSPEAARNYSLTIKNIEIIDKELTVIKI